MTTVKNAMQIGLLATGTELVEGDVLNTNGPAIARALVEQGLSVGLHVTASDAEQDIVTALQFLLQTHQTVIITGGLGPTSDDRTRFALSTVLAQELVFDEASWQQICDRYQQLQLPGPHPSNRQQAMFPQRAQIIPNKNGTAAGCCVQHGASVIYMLPGPPSECLPMFQEAVLPNLHPAVTKVIPTKLTWKLLGAVESEIAVKVDEAVASYGVTTGYRVDYPYLEVKVYAEQTKIAPLREIVSQLLQPYLVSFDNRGASELLQAVLAEFSGIISIEDYATHGRLQAALVTAATREHLLFTHSSAQSVLHITIRGLEDFWDKKLAMGKTTLTLLLQWRDKPPKEVAVSFSFRSQYAINYAVEHAALQILRFLQQT